MGERGSLNPSSTPVVVDVGSASMRCGFAHDQEPRCVFPSVIGCKVISQMLGKDEKFWYVGKEAQNKTELMNLVYPIKIGQSLPVDSIELFFSHMYDELKVDSKNQPILISQHILNSKENKEATGEVLFEKFGAPGIYLEVQNPLALYSAGHKTGLSIDAGHSGITVVPVHDGFCLKDASSYTPVGGSKLTGYLSDMYTMRGYDITLNHVCKIKENLCYISKDFQREMQTGGSTSSLDKTYKLPDGLVVNIESERCYCPEGLFNPELLGIKEDGIHKITHSSILKCNEIIQKELLANILMTGGTSNLKGFKERLFSELNILAPTSYPMCKINPDFRNRSATSISDTRSTEGHAINAVWIGGSILVSLNDFQQMWITKQEFEEKGAYIVSKLC